MIRTFTFALLAASPAFSQDTACAARDHVEAYLSREYGETPQVMGAMGGELVMEVFSNEDTGTWTTVITGPSGESCIAAAGENLLIISGEAL